MDESASRGRKNLRRQTLACVHCRRKKLRCDRDLPCSNCRRSRRDVCSYPVGELNLGTSGTEASSSTAAATPPLGSSSHLHCPERTQSPANQQPIVQDGTWCSSAVADILVTTSSEEATGSGGPARFQNADLDRPTADVRQGELTAGGGPQVADLQPALLATALETMTRPIQCAMIESKYIGSSNWTHAVALAPVALIWYEQEMKRRGDCWQTLQACKASFEILKSQRMLALIPNQYGSSLPSRNVSDLLLDIYLRNFEPVHRIVHLPTFRRDYELMWGDLRTASPTMIIKTQLCLAIGACAYDDTFSFRPQASLWIREADHWMQSLQSSSTISAIQIMCLSIKARQFTQAFSEDRIRISCGILLQTAMSTGLHRDPTNLPPMPVAEAELRRRLWATILELTIESSLEAGVPPLVSDNDFDCRLPSNIDDSGLTFDSNGSHLSHESHVSMTASLQIYLGQSIPIRLSIARRVNGLKPMAYRDVLKLDTEFNTALRDLLTCLRSRSQTFSSFQLRYCEFTMYRYIFALHIPYMCLAEKDPAYHYSRAKCVDAAVRLLQHSFPSCLINEPPLVAMRSTFGMNPPCAEYGHLVLCGSGSVRSIHFQAIMAIAGELAMSINDNCENLAWSGTETTTMSQYPGNLRNFEMLLLLKCSIEWAMHRVLAGQEDVKDLVFLTVVLASVEPRSPNLSAQQAMENQGRQAWLKVHAILNERVDHSASMTGVWTEHTVDDLDGVDVFCNNDFTGLYWDSFIPIPSASSR